MIYIRSIIFNFLFYSLTALMCFVFLPSLLMHKRAVLWVARFFLKVVYFLERYILGLDYEVRGLENLPKEGSFLVAAKHQSAYETMKLHFMFDDPTIILKKELLQIPIWGWFLGRTDPIAINRKDGRKASKQIIEGAKRVMPTGRPIIIFPQGTRVRIDQDTKERPYKIGIARMQEATGMPIVPMALNTGKFWPKGTWVKQPGKVIFEFLKPLSNTDETPEQVIKTLEKQIEIASQRLLNDA